MPKISDKQIVFLDSDHVIDMVRNLLDAPSEEADASLRGYFAPEPVDIASLRGLAAGVRHANSLDVIRSDDPSDASVIVFRRATITRELLERAPRLSLIQRLGARADSIDLNTAAERGVAVSCLPRRTLAYTAEHALLLMLALAKRLLETDAEVRAGSALSSRRSTYGDVAYNWTGSTGLSGLYGRTLGVVGLGEVGELVTRRARAFGMRVLYANRQRLPAQREQLLDVSFRPLPELLEEADIVSLHLRGTSDNARLIDTDAIRRMRPGSFLINTSRGILIDEDALYRALVDGHLGGAGLDVHAIEPRSATDRFCALNNVILTPHIAGGSRMGVLDEVKAMFENIGEALQGRSPVHARVDLRSSREDCG
jgi:phosphoglycerate dehydrogenase-like enzyme